MIRLSFMKAIISLLLLNIFGLIQSDYITEMELIGKWKLESVDAVHPAICSKTDFSTIIGSTMEFTDDNLLIITAPDGKELLKRTEKFYWPKKNNEFVLKSSKEKENQISKYYQNGDRSSFQITNLIEQTLKKE